MKSVTIFVTKLEILSLDLNQLHFVGGTKTDIGALAGVNITDDRLDERAQISGRAMMDFEHKFVLVDRDRIQRHQICDQSFTDLGICLKIPDEIAVGKNPE